MREHERDPQQPRLLRGPSFVEPAFRGADRRLVGVDHEVVATRSEVEAPRQPVGERRQATERAGLGWDEVAAEVGARLGDSRRTRRHDDREPRRGSRRRAWMRSRFGSCGCNKWVERPMTGDVRIPAGHERHPTRRAHRVLAERVRELHAPCGQRVDVRRARHRIAETPERVGAQLVGHEEHDVRAAGHRGTLRRCPTSGTLTVGAEDQGGPVGKLAVISTDGHVKASRAGYRDYVEARWLDDFDAWAGAMEGTPDAGNKNPKLPDESQWDSEFRLGHLDAQAVAAEVLFPNGLPFVDARFQDAATSNDLALAREGPARLQPVARRLLLAGAGTPRRPGPDLVRRHRPGDRGRALGQRARADGNLDAGAPARRRLLLRRAARPGVGGDPRRRPADLTAWRQRAPRRLPAGLRRHHGDRARAVVLLRAIDVAADDRRCLRALPETAVRAGRDDGRLGARHAAVHGRVGRRAATGWSSPA